MKDLKAKAERGGKRPEYCCRCEKFQLRGMATLCNATNPPHSVAPYQQCDCDYETATENVRNDYTL